MKTAAPYTFLGSDTLLEEAKYVVLPVPYDSTQSFRTGARFAPLEIINASRYTDLPKGAETLAQKTYTTPELEISKASPEQTIQNVDEAVSEILQWNKTPVLLGGEHSITLGAVNAAKKKYSNLSVLQIDAHADLYDEYEGSKYSHACVMRRIRELNVDCIQAAIRTIEEEEQKYIDENKQTLFEHSEKQPLNQKTISKITNSLSENVYITFDLDAFKPELVPEVGNPVPGGITWEEATSLLKDVFKSKNVIGFDVVELTPLTVASNSAIIAARLTVEMLAMKENNKYP